MITDADLLGDKIHWSTTKLQQQIRGLGVEESGVAAGFVIRSKRCFYCLAANGSGCVGSEEGQTRQEEVVFAVHVQRAASCSVLILPPCAVCAGCRLSTFAPLRKRSLQCGKRLLRGAATNGRSARRGWRTRRRRRGSGTAATALQPVGAQRAAAARAGHICVALVWRFYPASGDTVQYSGGWAGIRAPRGTPRPLAAAAARACGAARGSTPGHVSHEIRAAASPAPPLRSASARAARRGPPPRRGVLAPAAPARPQPGTKSLAAAAHAGIRRTAD